MTAVAWTSAITEYVVVLSTQLKSSVYRVLYGFFRQNRLFAQREAVRKKCKGRWA